MVGNYRIEKPLQGLVVKGKQRPGKAGGPSAGDGLVTVVLATPQLVAIESSLKKFNILKLQV